MSLFLTIAKTRLGYLSNMQSFILTGHRCLFLNCKPHNYFIISKFLVYLLYDIVFNRMGWEFNVALMPYGDEWRQHRRVCQQHFNPQTARKYESLQMEKVRGFLQSLIETPKQFDAHNKVWANLTWIILREITDRSDDLFFSFLVGSRSRSQWIWCTDTTSSPLMTESSK